MAITFVNSWSVVDNGGGASSTVSSVAPAGGVLFALVAYRGSGTPEAGSVVFNGSENFTRVAGPIHNGTAIGLEIWELVGATQTTADVVATVGVGSAFDTIIVVAEFSGVDQTTPSDATGTDTDGSVAITTLNANSVIFGGFASVTGASSITLDGSITQIFNDQTGTASTDLVTAAGRLAAATAGAYSFDATISNATTQVGAVIEIKEATGGGTDATATPSGVSATGAVGSVSVQTDATVAPTGVSATGQVGSVTVSTGANATATPTGVAATGTVGSVTVTVDATAAVTGVSATGAVGSVTASGTGDATATPSGVSATGQVGSVTVLGTATVAAVSGVEGVGGVGAVKILGWLNPPPASGTWTEEGAANDVWTPVPAAGGSWS